MTTDNQKTKNQIEASIKMLEEIAAKETRVARRYAVLAARDHFKYAASALEGGKIDLAGRHLEAARRCILEARA